MARIRTIKPEFFSSEDIVSLSPLARLLYIALWCEADREGRMVWKPLTFKMRYMPGDDCDIHALCSEIVARGLVVLYGGRWAYIPAFHSHQHINPRESETQLPIPGEEGYEIDAQHGSEHVNMTRGSRVVHASVTHREEGKGREGKDSYSSPENPATPPALTVVGKKPSPAKPSPEKPPALPNLTETFVAVYHEKLPSLPAVRLLDDGRRRCVAKFWAWLFASKKSDGTRRATTAQEGIDWVGDYFGRASENDFLMGRGNRSPGHENWRADFDFLLTEKGRKHVIEKTVVVAA